MGFPFGTSVQVRHRTGNVFGDPVDVAGCGIAPREQAEGLADQWPSIRSGRTVFAPFGSPIHRGDRLVIAGVDYDVDGEPAEWQNPYTGRQPGIVVETLRLDELFPITVAVRTYLGSGSLGRIFADPVESPAFKVDRQVLRSDEDATQETPEVTLRVPPTVGDAASEEVFSPESKVDLGSREVQVVSTEPFYKFGVVAWVEVVCR